ncbi:unnamed protein product [Orchesella dallaii]|uniref:Lipase 3 n=1 Tax=Orchesella dallaii TaxID=48710 RepID=A0ABP1RS20_9HEXA
MIKSSYLIIFVTSVIIPMLSVKGSILKGNTRISSFLTEFRSLNSPNEKCIDSDLFCRTPNLLRKYGYPVETHTTLSPDGFKLVAHRIPYGSHRGKHKDQLITRKPVILAHALLCSSSDWLMNVPEKALGYILADAGYDVWLINSRGNSYSSGHLHLNEKDWEYWDFSYHEMGTLDVPAWIDYILNVTSHSNLHYVGHSMGSTAFFIGMSERPEYNEKIDKMFALAPALYITESRYRLLAKLFSPLYGKIINLFGASSFVPTTFLTLRTFFGFGCKMVEPFCDNFFFFVAGYNPDQRNSVRSILTPFVSSSLLYLLIESLLNLDSNRRHRCPHTR